ncbi:MAG: peroxide stress protein YaaA [Thermodesulfobacteriota bacterium]|nr:peroxide stress protein YaaA [Thermodesulfobacteriota bacterium]
MIVILSPSKGQDFSSPSPTGNFTLPDHLHESQILIDELRKIDSVSLQQLMAISKNIADLNVERYKNFAAPFTPKNAKQAIVAFTGDVYSQIQTASYSKDDLNYAQTHLRILSGLYGCLRPLDLIQPYRLEMKTKLATRRGTTLYQFWGERITETLNAVLINHSVPVLINLASTEYFKVIKAKSLNAPVVTLHFKEIKNGKARVIAIFAKRARGLMADYILKNRIENPDGIKAFQAAGYRFSASESSEKQLTFTRPQP